MAAQLLMPKATAVWLVDNTSLTFDQIAEFCGLHKLEVKGIADGDVAQGIKGMDPISSGQLTRSEIDRAQESDKYRLKMAESDVVIPEIKSKRGPRYTPVSRRQDRPNAILWLVRHHTELKDSEIIRLVGTTKPTITALREGTHWNSANLQPLDPVTLGLCTQIDLDAAVQKAARRVEREAKKAAKKGGVDSSATLLPTEETTKAADAPETVPDSSENQLAIEKAAAKDLAEKWKNEAATQGNIAERAEEEDELKAEADSAFAKLSEIKTQD